MLNEFSEAIAFIVACETQQEIDELWTKLVARGGDPSPCGWLTDTFGLDQTEPITGRARPRRSPQGR